VTFFEQALGFVSGIIFLSGFIWALILYIRAGRRSRVVIVALSWVLVSVLYHVVFFVLSEDSAIAWILGPGLLFVFCFAFWGVIDFAIHAKVRLKGGQTARFVQGVALLFLSAVLLVGMYFLPDVLDSLPIDVGFGGYFLGMLGSALAAVLCVRAGARALYNNWSALPSVLAKRKAKVEVTPEKETYLPGEAVNVAVRIEAKKGLDIHEARVELFYSNRYSYSTSDSRGGSLLIDETDKVVMGIERFLQAGVIRKGSVAERRVSLELPEEVPPTGEGNITGVLWAVRVVLEAAGVPDINEEAPITVLSSHNTYAPRIESEPVFGSPEDCRMEFRLLVRSFRAGERIEGRLVLTPKKNFEGQDVRVELVRREIVLKDEGNTDETIEAQDTVAESTRMQSGISQEHPFGVAVPRRASACPSSETEQTYVRWFIRGVIRRKLHRDPTLEQELNIYNGPPINGATQRTLRNRR
jgi:hypothetical protein